MRLNPLADLMAEERRRAHYRRMVGPGQFELTYQVPMRGEAGTALTMNRLTAPIEFDVGFVPEQDDEDGVLTPNFRAGFQLEPTGDGADIQVAFPVMGVAHVEKWHRNSIGLYVAASVQVGAIYLGEGVDPVDYKGRAYLSFFGEATQHPVETEIYEDEARPEPSPYDAPED